MIGEMLGELTGKIIGQRIVAHWGGPTKIESTMETKGKILGQEVTLLATFWRMERPQGGMFSKGNGVLMTKDGGKVMLRGPESASRRRGRAGACGGPGMGRPPRRP